MDKKELILTVAKDIYIAKSGKDVTIKSLKDVVKMVEELYNSIKD